MLREDFTTKPAFVNYCPECGCSQCLDFCGKCGLYFKQWAVNYLKSFENNATKRTNTPVINTIVGEKQDNDNSDQEAKRLSNKAAIKANVEKQKVKVGIIIEDKVLKDCEKGGGVRNIMVDKSSANYIQIFSEIIKLYFPTETESLLGTKENYKMSLLDYQKVKICENSFNNLDDYLEKTGLNFQKKLFYLQLKKSRTFLSLKSLSQTTPSNDSHSSHIESISSQNKSTIIDKNLTVTETINSQSSDAFIHNMRHKEPNFLQVISDDDSEEEVITKKSKLSIETTDKAKNGDNSNNLSVEKAKNSKTCSSSSSESSSSESSSSETKNQVGNVKSKTSIVRVPHEKSVINKQSMKPTIKSLERNISTSSSDTDSSSDSVSSYTKQKKLVKKTNKILNEFNAVVIKKEPDLAPNKHMTSQSHFRSMIINASISNNKAPTGSISNKIAPIGRIGNQKTQIESISNNKAPTESIGNQKTPAEISSNMVTAESLVKRCIATITPIERNQNYKGTNYDPNKRTNYKYQKNDSYNSYDNYNQNMHTGYRRNYNVNHQRKNTFQRQKNYHNYGYRGEYSNDFKIDTNLMNSYKYYDYNNNKTLPTNNNIFNKRY